ncbi:hypothetical protein, partial [Rheinheimera faecalis]|uniref:hypothetical protein n=1 Tax=Rheinheimera faecalis TaxID=2901141 RepID=UPI001E3CD466
FRCDLGSPFLWIAFFWRSKRKYLAKGETLLTEFLQIGRQAVIKKKIGRSSFPAPGENTRQAGQRQGSGGLSEQH